MSGYIGNTPVPQATQTHQTFIASASQTSFPTLGYTPGFEMVWLNGVKLIRNDDYTATNGSDIVLASGAAANDILEFVGFKNFEAGTFGGYYKGDNGTLGVSPGDIFRVNSKTLSQNVTILSTENASAAGPLTIASGVTVTVISGGNLRIV